MGQHRNLNGDVQFSINMTICREKVIELQVSHLLMLDDDIGVL